jgi:hypothetical protein
MRSEAGLVVSPTYERRQSLPPIATGHDGRPCLASSKEACATATMVRTFRSIVSIPPTTPARECRVIGGEGKTSKEMEGWREGVVRLRRRKDTG